MAHLKKKLEQRGMCNAAKDAKHKVNGQSPSSMC